MTNTTPTIIDISSGDLDILDIAQFPDELDFAILDEVAIDEMLRCENEEMDKTE